MTVAISAYRLGLSLGAPRRAQSAYQAGADSIVGARLGNWPGWLLDQIRIMDSDLTTLDSGLLAELSRTGCHLGVPGLVYPASSNSLGIADGEAGATMPDELTDQARVATQPVQCIQMAAYYDGPWRAFLASWAQWADGHRGHGAKGWYQRFWGWEVGDTINQFRDQLDKLRKTALASGFSLAGVPSPSEPPIGLFDRAGRALLRGGRDLENAGSGLADLVKLLLYAVIGVGVVLAIGFVLHGGWATSGGRTLMLGAGAG